MNKLNRSALVFVLVAVVSFGLGFWARGDGEITTAVITSPAPNVQRIEVPVPVITEKVVKQFVSVPDQKFAASVVAENRALKVKVEELSVSLAKATSTGSGAVITETIPANSASNTPPILRTTFKDWRLDFTAEGDKANYTLSQQFSIINTIGKNKRGETTQLVRLFEIGPGDTRTPIPTVSTQTLVAEKNPPHFYVKLTVQGGAGVVSDPKKFKQETVAIVATPWLKRGRTTATEDTRYAFLSPAVTFKDGKAGLGVLPLSFNVGSLPNQPFTNIWVSPFVGINTDLSGNISKIGIVGTFTF